MPGPSCPAAQQIAAACGQKARLLALEAVSSYNVGIWLKRCTCVLLQRHPGPAIQSKLVLCLEHAQLVLTQRDIEELQAEDIAEFWKVGCPSLLLSKPTQQTLPVSVMMNRLSS